MKYGEKPTSLLMGCRPKVASWLEKTWLSWCSFYSHKLGYDGYGAPRTDWWNLSTKGTGTDWCCMAPSGKMIQVRSGVSNNFTLWLFNIALENGPFIDGLPITNGFFSMAMLNNQMVLCIFYLCEISSIHYFIHWHSLTHVFWCVYLFIVYRLFICFCFT